MLMLDYGGGGGVKVMITVINMKVLTKEVKCDRLV